MSFFVAKPMACPASEPQPKVDANASFEIICVYCLLCSCVKHSLELLDEAETQEKQDKTGALNAIREVFFFPPHLFRQRRFGHSLVSLGGFYARPPPVCLGAFRGNFASCSGNKSKPRDPFRVRGGIPLGPTGLVPRHH